MTVAFDLIKRAYYLSNVKDPREEIEGFEAAEGLTLLNAILDDWGNKSVYIPNYQLVALALTQGVYSYTVSNPIVRVMEGQVIDSNNTLTSLTVANQQMQNASSFALVSARPTTVFVQNLDNDEPNISTVFFYPTPDQSYTANLRVKQRLAEVALYTEITELPKFYFKTLVYQLAWDLSVENMTVLSDKFEKEYNRLIRELKSMNRRDGSVQTVNPYRGVRYYRPWGTYVV